MEKHAKSIDTQQIIHYKLKGRHGTHAPFVYDFVAKILRNPSPFKSFLGKYFVPVSRNSDLKEQKKRFIDWYKADLLWDKTYLPDCTDLKDYSRVLFIISPESMESFLQIEAQKEFLEKLQNTSLDYAFWTERKGLLSEFYPYFNRFMSWKEASLYIRHTAFYEKEVFLLK